MFSNIRSVSHQFCSHKMLPYLESQRRPRAEFLVFQVWKRIAFGQMPDCMRRISNNMEHIGRLLGSYTVSATRYFPRSNQEVGLGQICQKKLTLTKVDQFDIKPQQFC